MQLIKATPLEFRLRFWIMAVIYVLGFTAPWDAALHLDGSGPNAHVWGLLAALLSKSGAMGIASAFNLVLALGIVCALAGASLRTWGTAYLGVHTVRDAGMRGDTAVADGPYRHLRNPLYLGSWLFSVTLTLPMPASGAIFTIVLIGFFLMRLIRGEESFLTEKLGDAYTAYCAQAPRLLPKLRANPTPSEAQPQWVQAVLAETFTWGVTASFAILGWRYNAHLLVQCILVSFGLFLVVRAFQM